MTRHKIALDPVTAAGTLAMGKIMLTNALGRHGMKLAPVRRLAQEVAGVGIRTAQQGKPMVGRGLREAAAIGIDPKLTSLYETAHHIGSKLRPGQLVAQRDQALHSLTRHLPDATQHANFIRGIPLESRGVRKVVDYGFKPVGEVAQDIKGLLAKKKGPLIAARPASARAYAKYPGAERSVGHAIPTDAIHVKTAFLGALVARLGAKAAPAAARIARAPGLAGKLESVSTAAPWQGGLAAKIPQRQVAGELHAGAARRAAASLQGHVAPNAGLRYNAP